MTEKNYHVHITGEKSRLSLNLKEVFAYKDLILLFTKRTLRLYYKQTILGPLWLILKPLLTSIVYAAVFKGIAGLSTNGTPALLFYLCSHGLWTYFASTLKYNSGTFVVNADVFGKVYFPRLTISFSSLLTAMAEFGVEFGMVLLLLLYFVLTGQVSPKWWMIPLAVLAFLCVGLMGLGFGIIISSLTTKYRDLTFVADFGIQLWMYATPVVYPLSQMSAGNPLYRLLQLNPMTAPMEIWRFAFLGEGSITAISLASMLLLTALALFGGILIFNRVERTFIDTV